MKRRPGRVVSVRSLSTFAVGCGVLAGCRDAPELTMLPDPPAGLEVSWAFDDCAPWDGPATTIILADTMASDPRTAPLPHAWVSLYRPALEVAGRTFRWDEDDKNTGGAMRCDAEGQCEAATKAVVRMLPSASKAGLAGAVDFVFPSGAQVSGGFRAVWTTHELLCG